MGTRGPQPKRSTERLRRNEPGIPLDIVNVDGLPVEAPPGDETWHPIALEWYESLAASGQARFYEPSDWATAVFLAESMSRDLKAQPIGVHPETGKAVMAKIPIKGASMAAYLKGCGLLGVTEGDRRRLSIEIRRGAVTVDPDEARADAAIVDLAARLAGGG